MAEPTYKELYSKQLVEEKKENPKVEFILDTTEEDVDWLRPKKEGNK